MRYRTPLAQRLRYARNKRERYHRDEAYRLARINAARAQRGLTPVNDLSEIGDPRRGRVGAPRDASGRFA